MTTDTIHPTPKGFRPASRRRNRLAAGIALGALAIGGNAFVYATLNSSEPAVQVVRDVPAGELITADMLRTIELDADSSVNVVAGSDLASLVGRYAKVRLVSGSLVTHESLQSEPLVLPGNAVVAIQLVDSEIPIGLRERVPVRLVIPGDRNATDPAPVVVEGRVVGLPKQSNNALGTISLSVEVAKDQATIVAAADDVRVVLLVPVEDPAVAGASSPATTSTADDDATDAGAADNRVEADAEAGTGAGNQTDVPGADAGGSTEKDLDE